MIDYHTHILPCMDDGADSVQMSIKMIESLQQQGVDKVYATPHFDFSVDINEFLLKRAESYQMLSEQLTEKHPEIKLGAEIYFSIDMTNAPDLDKLCLEGTKELLIEMPFRKWRNTDINELQKIRKMGYDIILAHVERYIDFLDDESIGLLISCGFKFQANYYSLQNKKRRSLLSDIMSAGCEVLFGTDCHNMKERSPDFRKDLKVLEKIRKKIDK